MPDSISSVAATRSLSVTPERLSSANTAAASVEPTIEPSSSAVHQSRPTNQTPASAVMPAHTSTPRVASSRAGRSPVRKRRVLGAQAAVEQDDRERQVADPEAEPEIVEAIAARAVLAGQHAGSKEDEQEREPDARREQARQHAEEDERRASEHGQIDEIHASIVGARGVVPASRG